MWLRYDSAINRAAAALELSDGQRNAETTGEIAGSARSDLQRAHATALGGRKNGKCAYRAESGRHAGHGAGLAGAARRRRARTVRRRTTRPPTQTADSSRESRDERVRLMRNRIRQRSRFTLESGPWAALFCVAIVALAWGARFDVRWRRGTRDPSRNGERGAGTSCGPAECSPMNGKGELRARVEGFQPGRTGALCRRG